MTTYYQYTPGGITVEQLVERHTLPDEALVKLQEASEVLRLKYTTLAWYRCQGVGPEYVRLGGPSLSRPAAGRASP